MKKFFYFLVAIMALNLTGCYNDDDVWDAINEQDERIAALEAWQKTTNENIAALQAIVSENDYITAVKSIIKDGETVGYTISFLHQGDVTIYNGEKGDKGEQGEQGEKGDKGEQGEQGESGSTPIIGVVQQEDGKWYWTLNGELMKDSQGNTICANGKDGNNGNSGTPAPTPILKTGSSLTGDQVPGCEADAVYLSVDGGTTWTKVSGPKGDKGDTGATGPAGTTGIKGDSMFKEVKETASTVIFTLADETIITVPKYAQLSLTYNEAAIKNGVLNVAFPANAEFSIKYTMAEPLKYTVSINIAKNDKSWNIDTTTNGEIKFSAITEEGKQGSATIILTLTDENNQAFFYKVTVNVGKAISNTALADVLTSISELGLVADANGTINVEANKEAIEKTTVLNLSDKNLESLDGLEYFTNLEELNCSNNPLPATTDFTKFTKLTKLDCSNCFQEPVTGGSRSAFSIAARANADKTIDLSKNDKLLELYCSGNALETLDLSANTKLIHLSCNNNVLTTLDLTKNTALKEVSCNDNQLTTLTLGENAALEILSCYRNAIESLNLEKCTALKELHAYHNALSTLDVTTNTDLIKLSCPENQIESLDVTKNTELTVLSCERNKLTVLDLSQNTKLIELWCDANQLQVLDITPITALEDLRCGIQKTADEQDQKLKLTMTEVQTAMWFSTWENKNLYENQGVIVPGAETGSNNTGKDFNNGGEY